MGFCYIFKYKVWKSWLMIIYWIIKFLKMKVYLKIVWFYKYNYLFFREVIEFLVWCIKFVEIYEIVMIKWFIMLLLCCINVYGIIIIVFLNLWGEILYFFFCDLRIVIVLWMYVFFFRVNKKWDFSIEGWNIRLKYCMNKKYRGLCWKLICEIDCGCYILILIYKYFFRVLG